jgi:DNA-binding NtrC family response regulator
MNETRYPTLPILLVDDEEAWLRSLALTLKSALGINNLIRCHESRKVMDILSEQEVGLILLDLTMPYLSGEDLLQMVGQEYPDIPIIILSGLNQLETAVRCMQLGAVDYYVKTEEKERLIGGIQRAMATRALRQENRRLKKQVLDGELEHPETFARIHTGSRKMHALFQFIEAVAGSSEPILITGESGVGKELIAHAIHQLARPQAPWVAVNVAGLDDNHFSDTLFGHTRGAFTGADRERRGMIEEAAGGTLFLDEIGDLSLASQVKLLRLLQEGEYFHLGSDVPCKARTSFVLATNVDLDARQNQGTFRRDLYYRLKAHHVHIPPLRERLEDLPVLLDAFFEEAARTLNKKKPAVPHGLAELLSIYDFPGNVRELRAMVFNALSLHKSHKLSFDYFKQAIGFGLTDPVPRAEPPGTPEVRPLAFPEKLPTLEKLGELAVTEAMRRARGNQTLAASFLGITRQGLSKRLKKRNPAESIP